MEILQTIAYIAAIIIAMFLIVALVFSVWILNQIKDIFMTVKRETHLITHDIDDMRDRARKSGGPIMKFALLLLGRTILKRFRK